MPATLDTRLAAFATSLREAGAIRSDPVERAFATVARHRCVPRFRYGPDTITVPQDALPGSEVLDLIYSHQSLLTSTGHNGQPPSSSSAPTLMARMLEALDLRPGLTVLEIGAGTGYNAALITTITGTSVMTVEAGADTAQGAAESVRRLGLDHRVTVRHGDGYLGEPSSGPYDRIIVTCGVSGLSPHWLGQLAPDGRIVAPITHGGVHPVLLATHNQNGVHGSAALWADFMPAAGPLRPAELVGHDPADYLAATALTRIPEASPARSMAAYHDLWFFLATRHPHITRAYTGDGTIDPAKGACALRVPPEGRRGYRPTVQSRSSGNPRWPTSCVPSSVPGTPSISPHSPNSRVPSAEPTSRTARYGYPTSGRGSPSPSLFTTDAQLKRRGRRGVDPAGRGLRPGSGWRAGRRGRIWRRGKHHRNPHIAEAFAAERSKIGRVTRIRQPPRI